MDLFEVLRPESVVCRRDLPTKDAVIAEVARLAKACPLFATVKEEEIVDRLTEREEQGTTGIGQRIALPHCKLKGVDGFVAGLITLAKPVEFGSLDGEPVEVVVFIIGPEERSNEYIRILSSVSHVLSIPGSVDELLSQTTDEGLRESFLHYSRDDAEPEKGGKKSLFHVVIQNEELFQDILQVFEGLEASRALVVSSESAGSYLSKMPLFAGLWSDGPTAFCEVIVAVVNENAVNEIVRRIDQVTGGLERSNEVMVCVSELALCKGHIET